MPGRPRPAQPARPRPRRPRDQPCWPARRLLIGMIGVGAAAATSPSSRRRSWRSPSTRLDDTHRGRPPATLRDLARLLGELPAELRPPRTPRRCCRRGELERVVDGVAARRWSSCSSTRCAACSTAPRPCPSTGRPAPGSGRRPVQRVRQPRRPAAGADDGQRLAVGADGRPATPGPPRHPRRGRGVGDHRRRNASAKALQARLKLCRLYGIWNILVTHRLSDLRAQADDGSSASKVADGAARRHPDQGRVPPGHRPARRRPAACCGSTTSSVELLARADQGPGAVDGRRPQRRRPPRRRPTTKPALTDTDEAMTA